MLLEVCANSYQSAFYAQQAGAQRIELCEDLSVGGVTPNTKLILKVLKQLSIPVFVLVRPRAGDFVYTDKEFELLKQSILQCKSLGCQGIVSGVLNADATIDLQRTKELIELSRPLAFTFHRAFDSIPDPAMGLEQLIELGADRVLTSGQGQTAEEGIEMLIKLKDLAAGNIVILPGSGINPQNAALFKENHFSEIHSSARKKSKVLLNQHEHSDQLIIAEILNIIS